MKDSLLLEIALPFNSNHLIPAGVATCGSSIGHCYLIQFLIQEWAADLSKAHQSPSLGLLELKLRELAGSSLVEESQRCETPELLEVMCPSV